LRAFAWCRKSAELGLPEAQIHLANCYLDGDGVAEDKEQAIAWFRKAADQGNNAAQYNLANCYLDSDGIAEDYEQAVAWFRKAAEQGNDAAQYNLAHCYFRGQGVAEDKEQAIAWFRKAAEQGYAIAARTANFPIEWIKQAAKRGNKDAIEAVKYWPSKICTGCGKNFQPGATRCWETGCEARPSTAERRKKRKKMWIQTFLGGFFGNPALDDFGDPR
jgi:TPR repeat protein